MYPFNVIFKFFSILGWKIWKSNCFLDINISNHLKRAQGGPRGGPLVVPPVLDKNLANHMQSNRNDLIGISMCGTMKSWVFNRYYEIEFRNLTEKKKSKLSFLKKSNMIDIRTSIVISPRPWIEVLFQSCATISRSLTLKFSFTRFQA